MSQTSKKETTKKGKIGLKSVARVGLISAAAQPRAGGDPAHGKGLVTPFPAPLSLPPPTWSILSSGCSSKIQHLAGGKAINKE